MIGLIFFSGVFIDQRAFIRCQRLKETEIKGIVDTTFFNEKGQYVFLLKNQNIKLIALYINEKPSDYFNKGDSIFKPSGVFEYHIYRRGILNDPIILISTFDCTSLK